MDIKQINKHEENAKKCLDKMIHEIWLQGLPCPCAGELQRELEKHVEDYFARYKARFA